MLLQEREGHPFDVCGGHRRPESAPLDGRAAPEARALSHGSEQVLDGEIEESVMHDDDNPRIGATKVTSLRDLVAQSSYTR